MNDSLIICYFLIFIVSCSGSSANNSEEDSNDITQTLSSHPLVWDFASPESVGMSSSLLEEAFDYAFEDGSFTQASSKEFSHFGITTHTVGLHQGRQLGR